MHGPNLVRIEATSPDGARTPLVLRAEGPLRALSVLGSYPHYILPLAVATPIFIGQAHLGGWWAVLLLCDLAVLCGLLIAGAHRCEVRLTHDEVIDRRIIGTRRWRWDQVGCIAVGSMGRGAVQLVVCVLHDPSPHRLRGFPLKSIYKVPVSSVADLISSHGFPIEQPSSDAHQWWAFDPRGKSVGAL